MPVLERRNERLRHLRAGVVAVELIQLRQPGVVTSLVRVLRIVRGKSIIYRDQRVGLWRQAIEGGAPVLVQGLPAEKIYGFAWSRDNKFFAYTLGTEIRDVVLVSATNGSTDNLSSSPGLR